MKHKRQHYVPQSYLVAWADAQTPAEYEPYVWIIDKHSLQISNRAPKNILFEIDLYTLRTEEAERDLSLEQGLSRLERDFIRIRDDVIADHLPLNESDRTSLIAFMAAMHSRTHASGERWKPFWQELLHKMKAMQEWAATASPKDIARASQVVPIGEEEPNIVTIEEVEELVDKPVPSMLGPLVLAEARQLVRLDLAILRTRTSPGFITSDNPVVWADPEGYKRPPPHQGPALMYPTIEISMPISPGHSLLLNRRGLSGYINLGEYGPLVDLKVVQAANWRIRAAAKKYIIVNRPIIMWDWFF